VWRPGVKGEPREGSFQMAQNHYKPIFAGSKVIGKVNGDTFYKSIRKNHFLRCPPAIAFDIDSLTQAEQAGAIKVQVTDKEDGTIYRATIQHIRDKGREFNRGFGDQIFLTMEGWTKIKRGGGEQLSMFGGNA
jgi:hypothetical protein